MLLVKLEESWYECHIRNIFMGALSYADDYKLIESQFQRSQ